MILCQGKQTTAALLKHSNDTIVFLFFVVPQIPNDWYLKFDTCKDFSAKHLYYLHLFRPSFRTLYVAFIIA